MRSTLRNMARTMLASGLAHVAGQPYKEPTEQQKRDIAARRQNESERDKWNREVECKKAEKRAAKGKA